MSDKEILEKAIAKAIDGGWDTTHFSTLKGNDYKHPDEAEFRDLTGSWHEISPADIIFNHDFAKALWGDDITEPAKSDTHMAVSPGLGYKTIKHGWQHHLQQMVISPDPIQYLGENITETKEK